MEITSVTHTQPKRTQPGFYPPLSSCLPVDSLEPIAEDAIASAERVSLARQLLEREKSGRLELLTQHPSGVKDGADPRSNIVDTAAGRPARRSSYGNAPGGTVNLSVDMLRGINSLTREFSFAITSLAGASHSPNSNHYRGTALDVDTINGQRVSINHPQFRYFMKRAQELGAVEVYGPGDSGHTGHVHLSWSRSKSELLGVDGEALYQRFLDRSIQEGSNADHLAYLDRGIDGSFLKSQIGSYPSQLKTTRPTPQGPALAYPESGSLPSIEEGLEFLHPDIAEACLCLGSSDEGQLQARWLGRNARTPAQMWSATKTFPMMRAVIKAQQKSPLSKPEDWSIPGAGKLPEIFESIVSYRQGGSRSNRLARTLKQFDSPVGQENWLKGVTGNQELQFRGGYGESPTVTRPTLVDQSNGSTLLTASGSDHTGSNLVSAYDLCRTLTNLAWHPHMNPQQRLPGLQQAGADTLVRALGTDSARFVDVALEELDLKDRLDNLVVLSKLGFGLSDQRNRWESVYSAFVSFRDRQTGRSHQLALALRGHHATEGTRPAVELDSRMASQVALILQKVVTGEFFVSNLETVPASHAHSMNRPKLS